MALTDEVQTRIASALLIELTNQGDRTASSIDTNVLAAAAADAEAEFALETGVTYDNSVASHVSTAVPGVLYYLHTYTGMETARQRELETRWRSALSKFGNALGHTRRILPRTSPNIERSTQPTSTRPDFDRTRWDRFTLDQPGSSTEDDE